MSALPDVAWLEDGGVLCCTRLFARRAPPYPFGPLPRPAASGYIFSAEALQQVGYVLLAIGVTGAFAGWTMPAWGPRLDRMRSYRQLRPLWRALSRATPEVVFEAPDLGRGRWWRIGDMDFRLYRRIIEIRDSRLALRPYLDEDIAAAARQRGEEAGLEGEVLRATVEAAMLAAAIRAKAEDQPAVRRPTDSNMSGDMDLAAELIWFTQVAKAFAGSPVVAGLITVRTASPAP